MSQRNKAARKRVPWLIAVLCKKEKARAIRFGSAIDEAIRWNV